MLRLFVPLIVVMLALPAASQARPIETAASVPQQVVKRKVYFDQSVPKVVRRGFQRAVSRAPRQFRRMASVVDGQLVVSMRSKKYMRGSAGISTWKNPAVRPYRIYFSKAVEWNDFQARVVAAHELGHIFDFSGVSGKMMRKVFLKKAKQSKQYKKCFKKPGADGCMPLAEVFADHVAFYAIEEKFTSGYGIPRLMSDKQIASALKRMWNPKPNPGGAGGD